MDIILYTTWVLFASLSISSSLTDKKIGSLLLLIPASSLEKGLSMILISGIITPLFAGFFFFGTDTILCLITHETGIVESISPDMSPFIGIIILIFFNSMLFFILSGILPDKTKLATCFLGTLAILFIAHRIVKSDNIIGMDRFSIPAGYISLSALSILLTACIILRIKKLSY